VPILALVLLIFAIILAGVLLLPLSLIQRYRVGTRRQQARGWLITVNLIGIALSSLMFVVGAAITNFWVPNAFRYTTMGLLGGCILGLLGLLLTRWEPSPRALHYTPNRLLVLAVTLTIAGRIVYSFWRAWETWGGAANRQEWLVTWGVAEALGAGGVVLGYYLTYWLGVRRRYKRHERRSLRTL
jgi:hypothetical protein